MLPGFELAMRQPDSSHLLIQLEHILESDPLIDEVGFVHPSQFLVLNEEAGGVDRLRSESRVDTVSVSDACDSSSFWNRDHKLGISTGVLLPLYNAAKQAFMTAVDRYKKDLQEHGHNSVSASFVKALECSEGDVMKHTRALLLLSSDFGTAWNSRFCETLLIFKILHELSKFRDWAGLHAADNSCFHYRARLLLWLLEHFENFSQDAKLRAELYLVWKDELDWVEGLIKRYIGREALWLHRRFLSVCWIKHFASVSLDVPYHPNDHSLSTHHASIFISKELQFFESCTPIPDNNFQDHKAQATYAVTYIMWLMKKVPEFPKVEASKLKSLLKEVCPEKCTIWDGLISLCADI